MSIKIMSTVWEISGLTSTQKIVLLSLADQSNDDGVCYPSAVTTSKRTGLCERSTRSTIADLEKLGHLSRKIQSGKATIYYIHPCIKCTTVSNAPLHHMPQPLHLDSLTPASDSNITVSNRQEPSIGSDKPKKTKTSHQEIVDAYHRILPELPKVRVLTDKRKTQIKSCSAVKKTFCSIDFWEAYFTSIRSSQFHMGNNDRGWTADFDWLTNKTNFVKMYERGCK